MRFILIAILWLILLPVSAEVVALRTGTRIIGEILLHNEEVIIIRTNSGARYQYPTSEVLSIEQEGSQNGDDNLVSSVLPKTRPVDLRLEVHGGLVSVPSLGVGGQVGLDFMLGSHAIQENRVFVGGGIGYRAKFINNTTYSFIPLQAIMSIPLTDSRHAPVIGFNIGYGFSVDKATQGGMCAGTHIGWNYLINQQSNFAISLLAEWQQATTDVVESIIDTQTSEEKQYLNHKGCNFISVGLKLAVSF